MSVLHIHGTEDSVIRFDGDATEPDPKSGGKTAFYAGAQDMLMRWSRRADCDWHTDSQPYAILDLDQYVPGAETQAFRTECAEGINLELWKGIDSGPLPRLQRNLHQRATGVVAIAGVISIGIPYSLN